jgi:anti-anti-sigma factor
VTGEVDVATCGLLRDRLLQIVADEDFRGLVVNLADVRFMDSTGIGVLVGVWRRVAATTASLALAAPAPQVQAVLDTAGLTKILPSMTPRQTPGCYPAAARRVAPRLLPDR